jgi:hypothetical protein
MIAGMRSLVVLLLEGFTGDEVVVGVDGQELARRASVTTSPLLGLGDELRLDLPDDAALLTVAVPGRGLEETAPLPEGDPTMLVDLEEGALLVRPGTGREGAM